jgi:two-component system nitrate/nitrite response regulator NarL
MDFHRLSRSTSWQSLSPREQQVLDLLSQGASTLLIATELGVSSSTARSYVQRVLQRLGAHSRIEALSLIGPQRTASRAP